MAFYYIHCEIKQLCRKSDWLSDSEFSEMIPSKDSLHIIVMRGRSLLWAFLLSFPGVLSIYAQPVRLQFEPIGIEGDVSLSIVHSIIESKDGFIWFGSVDGLARYDGYSLKLFANSEDDTNSLSSNAIRSIIEDRNGFIWAGTQEGGLNKFDQKHNGLNVIMVAAIPCMALPVPVPGKFWKTAKEIFGLEPGTTDYSEQNLLKVYRKTKGLPVTKIFLRKRIHSATTLWEKYMKILMAPSG